MDEEAVVEVDAVVLRGTAVPVCVTAGGGCAVVVSVCVAAVVAGAVRTVPVVPAPPHAPSRIPAAIPGTKRRTGGSKIAAKSPIKTGMMRDGTRGEKQTEEAR